MKPFLVTLFYPIVIFVALLVVANITNARRNYFPSSKILFVNMPDSVNSRVSLPVPLAKSGITLVNIWSPRCKPCIQELPELARLQKKLGNSKLSVFAYCNYYESNIQSRFFDSKGTQIDCLNIHFLWSNDAFHDVFMSTQVNFWFTGKYSNSVPLSYLVHNDRIVKTYSGYSPAQITQMEADINQLLKQ